MRHGPAKAVSQRCVRLGSCSIGDMHRIGLVVVICCLAFSARAQSANFPSVVGGTTVAPGANVLDAGIGHSDLVSVGWRHGVSSRVELGLVASATFGYRGLVFMGGGDINGSSLGGKLQGRFKVRLLEAGIVSLGSSFEAGVSYSEWNVATLLAHPHIAALGIEFPVDVKLGLALSECTTLGFRVQMPLFIEFWSRDRGALELQPFSMFAYDPRVGVGIEHALNESLLLFFHVRVGVPHLGAMVDGQLGVAWRLPEA